MSTSSTSGVENQRAQLRPLARASGFDTEVASLLDGIKATTIVAMTDGTTERQENLNEALSKTNAFRRSLCLSENRTLRLFTLCCLYIAQGIPWGFVTVTFAAWLAKPEQGLSTDQIGPILAVASLPWSFKFLWGPMMDRFTIRSMGRRRPWIIFAQGMAILILGGLILIEDPVNMLANPDPDASAFQRALTGLIPGPLAALILTANIFLSMQDVAVDALAVDLLKEDERSAANGMMYGCSYLGSAIGGAGLGVVVARFGIQAGLLVQAALLSLIVLLPIFLRERPPETEDQALDEKTGDSSSIGSDLLRAFSLRSTILGGVLALGVRIGSGTLAAVFVDYLLKGGGWSQEEYSTLTGGWALLFGLTGSVAGGFIADRTGPRLIITIACSALGATWIAFGFFPQLIESKLNVQALLITQELLLGTMSAALFGLFMGISWPKVAATQFTTYMALMNLSTTFGSYVAGWIGTDFSIFEILIVSGILQILTLIPLALIDPKQTRRVLPS